MDIEQFFSPIVYGLAMDSLYRTNVPEPVALVFRLVTIALLLIGLWFYRRDPILKSRYPGTPWWVGGGILLLGLGAGIIPERVPIEIGGALAILGTLLIWRGVVLERRARRQ